MSQKDEKEEMLSKRIDRREFIKRAAVGAGAVAATMVAGGCGSNSSSAAPGAAQTAALVGPTSKTAWKFAVMGDTQWVADNDDGRNPNAVPVDIINALNQQFIAQGVSFVVQVGDMTENASSTAVNTGYEMVGTVRTAQYTYSNLQAEAAHAAFVQTLYNAKIGYFAHRGNHDSAPSSGAEFVRVYPQNLNGTMNNTPPDVFNTPNFDSALQPFPVKTGSTFSVGATNFSSPTNASNNLLGLSYSFDVNNARFVLIDQFTPLNNLGFDGNAYSIDTTVTLQQPWVKKVVANSQQHTFVFSHKGLITQQHQDVLFGECPADADFQAQANVVNGVTLAPAKTIIGAIGMNDFIRTLSSNNVKLYFCGHDHIHNRSIVKTTDSGAAAQVTHVLCQSCSSKFYTANENNSSGNGSVPPCTSNDAFYCGGNRQTQLSQEPNTVGYYIVTVDGPNVSVDYFSAPARPGYSKPTEQQITTTPALNFTKRETFGYSQLGKQFVLGNGDSFTAVKDTGPSGTAAAILSGANSNPNADQSGRMYYNSINTGWYPETSGTASDILALWGMGYVMGSSQTDVYTLSLTFDPKKGGAPVLATPDGNGNWIKAVDQNLGGASSFVAGPWKAGYALGTYGMDAASGTVWAVLNFNGYFAAVTVA
jgi:hypothetical protein